MHGLETLCDFREKSGTKSSGDERKEIGMAIPPSLSSGPLELLISRGEDVSLGAETKSSVEDPAKIGVFSSQIGEDITNFDNRLLFLIHLTIIKYDVIQRFTGKIMGLTLCNSYTI